MRALLLALAVLLILRLPEMGGYLRKGVAEFGRGLAWYREHLDEADAARLARGLAWALAACLLCVPGVCLQGWLR
jgi:hypothetical protein